MSSLPVAVVIACHNLGRTLREATDSVLGQTRAPSESVIVDDGSDDVFTRHALDRLEREGWRVVHTGHRGVSAARNLGISLTSAPLVLVLDADDALAPECLEAMCERLGGDPALDFVSCGMAGFGASSYVWYPPAPRLPDSLVSGIVHISSMFRREVWDSVGGFNESVRRSEDLEFWTRVLELGFRGEVIPAPLLHYRVRPASRYHEALLAEGNAECMRDFYQRHAHTAAQYAEGLFVGKELFLIEQQKHHAHVCREIDAAQAEAAELRAEIAALQSELKALGRPPLDFGEFRRTSPLSPIWGVDRGKPVDRFYIEAFLDRHRQDVRGRVLEVKDGGYTHLFGDGRVTRSDVLDIDVANEQATIVADLTKADAIPSGSYDTFILTQTLGLIYDAGAAIRHAARVLKPGGVLLCTVPAAGRISHEDGPDGDFWRFTEGSLYRLFGEVFPIGSFEITGFGNVLAGAAFLYGLTEHEVTADELRVTDPSLPLVYGIRAVKPDASQQETVPATPARAPAGVAPVDRRADAAGARVGRAVVLLYHRIGARRHEESLCIPAEAFREQMSYLRKHCTPVTLDELARATKLGCIPQRAVAVTFDDGYQDILTEAVPILTAAGVPATAYITGQTEREGGEFYWDLVGRLFAPDRRLPPTLTSEAGGLYAAAVTTDAERTGVRRHLMARFYTLAESGRRALAAELMDWGGIRAERLEGQGPLTADEIARLGAIPGFTIGGHTRRHLCLPLHAEAVQREEIAENKRWLENIIGRAVTSFAYPYGERDPVTVRIVRELGFASAVTVDGAAVDHGWPPLLMPRYEVMTTDLASFAIWIESLIPGGQ
jgi:peptidoglycan/xylan/chitin deacetylase (PgdA/CDA1 family)/GT2 family glycosyltransferase